MGLLSFIFKQQTLEDTTYSENSELHLLGVTETIPTDSPPVSFEHT